ncbi:chemotaxis protein CheW [Rhodobacteraceae bacterium HSP-20]|uniref:Chemotaxis protein CheW n=1 Tax=Paragemmobacter amnigenus TaxID=2852097 RepID=A0ABS6J199_9RHOB|nr:chemotaxis protein CheW [Rhodobacter amnigenus]MBU9697513.1 chemotaxis protein CheW [Rhodobacter amnigenus]MBV4388740.1 chemotaxis protein CheW [Rhodobacter amnigenus]
MSSVDVVTFIAEGSLYAVPVSRVQEILDLRPVAAMPNAPAHLLGIIDLRGANIPVVDLRRLLGRPAGEDTAQSRILVVSVTHGGARATIGVKTDRVIEVTALDDPELRPLEEAELLQWSGSAIAGIGRCKGEVVSVLDLDRLFTRRDLAAAPVLAAADLDDVA